MNQKSSQKTQSPRKPKLNLDRRKKLESKSKFNV
jgi:hypothetical protein